MAINKFRNLFILVCLTLLSTVSGFGQVTIINYDFNSGSSYGTLSPATASNIACTVSSTEAWQVYGGTASGTNAFTANATAGNAIAMANSSGTNTRYFQFQLSGSDLSLYSSYKVYLQGQRSAFGATVLTLAYSTNGTTFTNFATTQSPGNGSFTECPFDVSAISALNLQTAVYFRILASGASSTGTLRIDNFQIRATKSSCGTLPNVNAGSTHTITCSSPSVTLNGSSSTSGVTFSWTPGGSTPTNSTTTVSSAGTYTLKVTSSGGCVSTATVSVITNTIAPNVSVVSGSSAPTLSLTAYWPFTGNAQDQSGNANHGTVSGATLTADRFGNANKAYSFNGTTSNISVPNSSTINMDNSSDYTIAFWMKTKYNPITNLVLAKHIGGYWNGYIFGGNGTDGGYCNGAGVFNFYAAAGAYGDVCANNLIGNDTSNWYFVAGQYKSSTNQVMLYINGVLQGDIGTVSGTLSNTAPLSIGANTFKGFIDDIRFYNRLLTPTEITTLYNEPNSASMISCTNPNAIVTGTSTTSGVTYFWSPGGATTPTVSISSAGTYTLKVTNPVNGCYATSTVAVTGSTVAPVITIANSTPTVCSGSTATLTAGGALTYSWSTNEHSASINVAPTVTTIYTVTGVGANACVASQTISVNVYNWTVNAGVNEFVSPGSVVSLGGSPTASGGSGSYTYSWSPSVAYSPSSTNSNPSITVGGSNNYIVTVHDLVTGCVKTSSKIVSIDAPYYLHLKKILDAGYYRSHNGKIYFQFEEEYMDPAQVLNYSIVDDKNNAVNGIPAQIEVIGDNRYSLDLAGIGLSTGFYRIAVTNKKNEVFYARFKY